LAKSVLDIVIRTIKDGGGDKEVVKSLVSIKSGIGTAVSAFAALTGAAYAVDKVLDMTAGKAVEYANKVEKVANAEGLTAEEASRTIQVLDDLRVSYDDLTASISKNAQKTDFSVEGLAAASEAYLNLGTIEEKQAFARERYGKQWSEFMKVLEAGPDKIRAMSEATNEGLVLTEENIAQAREYQMALDAWNDSIDALTTSLGNDFLPTLTTITIGLAESNTIRERANQLLMEGTAANREEALALASATVQAEYHANALNQQTVALDESGDAALRTSADYSALLGMMQQLNDATEQEIKNIAYKQLQSDLTKSGNELTAEEADLLRDAGIEMGIFTEKSAAQAEAIQDLNRQLAEGTMALDTYIAKLNEIPDIVTVEVIQTGNVNGTNTITSQATGGPQQAGEPYLVHQDEVIVPAQNGYTLTQSDARRILERAVSGENGNRSVVIYGGLSVIVQGGVQNALDDISMMVG